MIVEILKDEIFYFFIPKFFLFGCKPSPAVESLWTTDWGGVGDGERIFSFYDYYVRNGEKNTIKLNFVYIYVVGVWNFNKIMYFIKT